MVKYIVKRILIFIPTLFAISLITFILSISTPGDPVDSILNKGGGSSQGQSAGKIGDEKAYIALRRDLGLDLPLFYFTIGNATVSDTLYKIPKETHRENLERLAWDYGVWDYVARYYKNIKSLQAELNTIETNSLNADLLSNSKNSTHALFETYDDAIITELINQLESHVASNTDLRKKSTYVASLKRAYNDMKMNKATGSRYIPTLNWYGLNNQYHVWLFGDVPWFSNKDETIYYHGEGFFRGDFGKSYFDNRPVNSKIWDSITITFMMSFIAIFLTYICALPLGVFTAVNKGKKRDSIVSTGLFMLYSMPNFWIGTMMVTFLCNPDYVNWFPPAYSLIDIPEDAGMWESFTTTAYHLILPLFCWTYGSLAYLSRQMRGGMLANLGMDYIRTAKAKGLSKRKIVWKHSFRNSMIPVITIFASVFPLAISGSIVLEMIFSINGMGNLLWTALGQRDYPVIFTIIMFVGILTLLGSLVADILYAVVDPRISYSSKKR